MTDSGPSDSYLRCSVCGRESTTNFSSSLRHGWEKCCGYTMTLVRTEADIDAAVGDAFAPARNAIQEAGRWIALAVLVACAAIDLGHWVREWREEDRQR